MDQCADWRRAFHGVRQPHVQRELRGLAHRAAENQKAGKETNQVTNDGLRLVSQSERQQFDFATT